MTRTELYPEINRLYKKGRYINRNNYNSKTYRPNVN